MPATQQGFYLGQELDIANLTPTGAPLRYDPDHLTTHGVCFGMTGSGKTGLCLVLLEEAIRSGIPCLMIDLKGDLANLAFTFPSLAPADFAPWVDPAEAARQGMTVEALAAATADRWRKGLAESGFGPMEIAALRAAAEIAIFTPGSTAGRPVNVLGGFAPPAGSMQDDAEMIRSRITQSVAALLDLAGVDADPVTSPEAIFLAGSFDRIWQRGDPVTLESLIRDLAEPPIAKLGVMDLDDLFPKAKRMATAMALNALVAAPGFAAWTKGSPLDPAVLLRADDGRPRASIFYLAHLSDRERSFFVASLLGSVVTWMRAQPGSSRLRALVHIDEIFGYMPPHPANPLSKEPLLTLLKQARAFGVGVMLATQNPVDVDYKGLANAGTWFLGRLQTDQDRQRLLDGMLGEAGAGVDRAGLSRLLANLPPRSFVLHDAREERLRLFASRWAMSYLRGPLTRDEIRRLPEARPAAATGAAVSVAAPSSASAISVGTSSAPAVASPGLVARPKIADGVPERFAQAEGGVLLRPHLFAAIRVTFEDVKAGIRDVRQRTIAFPVETAPGSPDWAQAQELSPAFAAVLATTPPPNATYESAPASWQRAATFKQIATSLQGWLAANESLGVLENAALKIAGRPTESRADFELRCRQEATRLMEEEMRAYQVKVEEKARRLRARVEKEEADIVRDEQEAQARKAQEAIGIGDAVLGALFGRRRSIGSAVLGAGQRRRMTQRAGAQAERSRREAEAARADLDAFEAEARAAIDEIQKRWTSAASSIEERMVRPKKTAIEILEVGVLWAAVLPRSEGPGGRVIS